MERTLILVKPDAFARNLTGEIIARFERKGLRLAALQQMTMSRELASQHYAEHEGKPFYGELVDFITSGPLVAMVLEGEQAIAAARQVIGATNPLEASHGLDPRRLRARGGPEHGPWLRRARVGGARGRPVLRRPRRPRTLARRATDPRLALAAAAGDPRADRGAVRGRAGRRRGARAAVRPRRWCSRTPTARRPRSPRDASAGDRPVLGVDTIVSLGAADLRQARRRRPRRRRCSPR